MSEIDRIAEKLRLSASKLAAAPAEERKTALLDVLRGELDAIPEKEIYGVLARLRKVLAPSDNGEAASLWECLSVLGSHGAAARVPEKPAPSATPPAGIEEAFLGKKYSKEAPRDAQGQERLIKLLAQVMDDLDTADTEFQRMLMGWRKPIVKGRTHETLVGLKVKSSLRSLLLKSLSEGGTTEEIDKRIRLLGAAASIVYISYHQAVANVCGTLRELIEPQALERNHGKEAWAKYRQLYVNKLQRLGPEFQQEFFETNFLQEFFRRLRNI